MEILVATGNKHKLQEIEEILSDLPVKLKSVYDYVKFKSSKY